MDRMAACLFLLSQERTVPLAVLDVWLVKFVAAQKFDKIWHQGERLIKKPNQNVDMGRHGSGRPVSRLGAMESNTTRTPGD